MKNAFIILSIIFFFLFSFSCDKAENNLLTYNSDIVSVEYGKSFGECVGYCIKSIKITGVDVDFSASGWTVIDKVPDIDISGEISVEDWESIVNKINFIEFKNLDEIIGCPDCADGGAEWVEITTDKWSHKITFEYYNEPEEVLNYIDDLRHLMDRYENQINQ